MGKIKDYLWKYYLNMGCTCAESVLYAANDAWNLGMSPDTFRVMGGFAGGLCSGMTCGAISGGVAALSYLYLEGNGHQSPLMRAKTAALIEEVKKRLVSMDCEVLRAKYGQKEKGCIATVTIISDIIDEIHDREFEEPRHSFDFRIKKGIFKALPELIESEYNDLVETEGAETLDCKALVNSVQGERLADAVHDAGKKAGLKPADLVILTDTNYEDYRKVWDVLKNAGFENLYYYNPEASGTK